MHYHRFIFTPKTGENFLKHAFRLVKLGPVSLRILGSRYARLNDEKLITINGKSKLLHFKCKSVRLLILWIFHSQVFLEAIRFLIRRTRKLLVDLLF